MATTNIGKPFGIVTSKNQATAITESKQTNNAGQFYITKTDNSNTGGVSNTEGNASDAIALTINGNVLRGISKDDATKLANLNIGSGTTTDGAFKYKGSVKNFESLPTNANIGDVYNILDIFKIDGATYPVNSCVFYFDDGNTKWHPLTDTLQIGTEGYVENRYSNLDRLAYISRDFHRPIDSFNICLDNDSGLYASNGKIYIKLGLGLGTSDIGIKTTLGKGLMFDDNANITVNPGSGLYLGTNSKLQLNIGSGLIIDSNNELVVPVGKELEITNSNLIKLNANYLSGTVKDLNNFYYSLGGIYFPDTIKSGQKNDNITVGPSWTGLKKNYGLILRCGTGLAFQEGYEDFGDNSSQILGHDGRYYVNIDNTTIGLNTNSKLRVKHDSTLSESSNGLSVKVGNNLVTGDDGININLPTPTPSGLQQLPVSTAAILVNDGNNGLCVDIPALKRLVELIMAAK